MVRNSVLRARTDFDRVRRLFNLVRRLAREAWSALGLKLVACIGTRLAGTGAQLASILLLTAYLDRVLDDGVLTLPWAGEVPARAEGVIYAAGTVIVGLFVLSGVLNYLYGRWSWRLASAFELHLIRRAAYMLSALPLWRKEIDGVPLTASTMRKVTGSDCRLAQFSLRHLLEGAAEPVAIAAWVGAMAWLNPSLTALIVPVTLVALPFAMQVNRRASSTTRALEETAAESAPERQLLNHRLRSRLIGPAGPDPWLERFLTSGHIAANAQTFSARHVVMEESKAVSTLTFGGLLLLVVWIGGGAALRGDMTWGALVAFLLITRALLGQAVSLGGTVTYLSRFYPALSRYFALVDGGAAAVREDEAKAAPAAPAAVTVGTRSLDGDLVPIKLRPDDRVGIMTGLAADTQLVSVLCAAVENAGEDALRSVFGRVAFVNPAARSAVRSTRAAFPILDQRSTADLAQLLTEVGLADVAEIVHGLDCDRPWAHGQRTTLPRSFSPAVLLALAAISDMPTVVANAMEIRKIPEPARRHLLGRLEGRLVLFVYPMDLPPGRLFAFDETALLVHLADRPDVLYLVRSSQWPGSKRRLQSLLRGSEGQAAESPREEAFAELEEHDV